MNETCDSNCVSKCDCGCNDPCFTTPLEALRFLENRLRFAGVSDLVASRYAKDLRTVLCAYGDSLSLL